MKNVALVFVFCFIWVTTGFGSQTNIIPSGTYEPFFKSKNDSSVISIASFQMDTFPVTNGEYLEFVTDNPKWRKSTAMEIFVDRNYLSHWESDLELGASLNPLAPVTYISWFAAKSFCKWSHKKLPTIYQWEYVASASEIKRNAVKDKDFAERILEWYGRPPQRFNGFSWHKIS